MQFVAKQMEGHAELRAKDFNVDGLLRQNSSSLKRVDWTERDDAMLLVGTHCHGWGSFDLMRLDPTLGLKGKIPPDSAEDSSILPKKEHVLHRLDSLIKTLKGVKNKELQEVEAAREAARALAVREAAEPQDFVADGMGSDSEQFELDGSDLEDDDNNDEARPESLLNSSVPNTSSIQKVPEQGDASAGEDEAPPTANQQQPDSVMVPPRASMSIDSSPVGDSLSNFLAAFGYTHCEAAFRDEDFETITEIINADLEDDDLVTLGVAGSQCAAFKEQLRLFAQGDQVEDGLSKFLAAFGYVHCEAAFHDEGFDTSAAEVIDANLTNDDLMELGVAENECAVFKAQLRLFAAEDQAPETLTEGAPKLADSDATRTALDWTAVPETDADTSGGSRANAAVSSEDIGENVERRDSGSPEVAMPEVAMDCPSDAPLSEAVEVSSSSSSLDAAAPQGKAPVFGRLAAEVQGKAAPLLPHLCEHMESDMQLAKRLDQEEKDRALAFELASRIPGERGEALPFLALLPPACERLTPFRAVLLQLSQRREQIGEPDRSGGNQRVGSSGPPPPARNPPPQAGRQPRRCLILNGHSESEKRPHGLPLTTDQQASGASRVRPGSVRRTPRRPRVRRWTMRTGMRNGGMFRTDCPILRKTPLKSWTWIRIRIRIQMTMRILTCCPRWNTAATAKPARASTRPTLAPRSEPRVSRDSRRRPLALALRVKLGQRRVAGAVSGCQLRLETRSGPPQSPRTRALGRRCAAIRGRRGFHSREGCARAATRKQRIIAWCATLSSPSIAYRARTRKRRRGAVRCGRGKNM